MLDLKEEIEGDDGRGRLESPRETRLVSDTYL